MSKLTIPEEFMGCEVEVAYDEPVPTQKGFVFPSVQGTIVEVSEDGVTVETPKSTPQAYRVFVINRRIHHVARELDRPLVEEVTRGGIVVPRH